MTIGYDIYITNNESSEQMDYEQQAQDFLDTTESKLESVFLKNAKYFSDDDSYRDIYNVSIKTPSHKWSFKFGQSMANSGAKNRKAPTAYDVLASLTKYEVGTFKDFCDDFGYEAELENENGYLKTNQHAGKTYKAVVKEYNNVSAAWPKDSDIELLSEIQ